MDGSVSLADIAAVTDRNGYGNCYGNGMFGMEWLFALLILPAITNGGFYGNGNRNAEPVTESGLCNAMNFNNLEGAVGRISDQVNGVNTNLGNAVCNLGYETLRNFNNLEAQVSSCCCGIEKILLENRYLASQDAANTNATIIAQVQSVKDLLCQQENARKDQRIQQLELNQALCGVVRYPNATTYNAGFSPFFGYNNNGNCNTCCNGGY